jgi:hypothetical protein
MTDDQVSRVRYYDQQILRAGDFVDEQAYHLAQRRRHNIAGHSWGIVYGLELTRNAHGDLAIQPGMAIDGYGRELVLDYVQAIPLSIFSDKGGEILDVFAEYAQQPGSELPAERNACRPAGAAGGNRVQETIRFTIRKAGPQERGLEGSDLREHRQPEEVPLADRRFAPTRVAPDNPARRWPVFLGQLRRDGDPVVSLKGRPYAGLRGEMVRAGSDWAWLQVGECPTNDYRFAVFLANDAAEEAEAGNDAAPKTSPKEPVSPILGIKAAAVTPKEADPATEPPKPLIELRADTQMYGDLTLEGGAIDFGAGPPYNEARPWRMYHAVVDDNTDTELTAAEAITRSELRAEGGEADGGGSTTLRAADAIIRDELRIELPEAGGTHPISEFVVGYWSAEQEDFAPCLTVAADGNVTVHGNLSVEGEFLRFQQAAASESALIRYVVGRTPAGAPQPAWFTTLRDELDQRNLLRESFLPFLVETVARELKDNAAFLEAFNAELKQYELEVRGKPVIDEPQ